MSNFVISPISNIQRKKFKKIRRRVALKKAFLIIASVVLAIALALAIYSKLKPNPSHPNQNTIIGYVPQVKHAHAKEYSTPAVQKYAPVEVSDPDHDSTPGECVQLPAQYWIDHINSIDATEQEKQWLLSTSKCESHYNNCAVSAAGYYGILQYSISTFNNAGGTDIWDGHQQIQLALGYYRVHGTAAWPVCGQ